MRTMLAAAIAATATAAGAAWAEPGLADEVYGPGVRAGETELELRSGVLDGGDAEGDWQIKAEASHAFTDWWRPGVIAEWERESGDTEFAAIAIENVFDFVATRDWPVRFGGYVEYEFKQEGADKVELKLLMERARGALGLRLNLIGEREVGSGAADAWELGYAAEAAYALNEDFELGLQGFGDAGTDDDFGGLGDLAHYWGPFARFELGHVGEGEIELQLGYLIGFGDPEADGQFRLKLAYEFAEVR